MASAAYATAKNYLSAAVEILPADAWERSYELAFTLHVDEARAAFFAGDPEGAQHRLAELHARARRPQDEAAIATLEIYLLTVGGRLDRAVEVMRAALRRYGLDLPLHPAYEEVLRKYEAVRRAMDERGDARSIAAIDALVELPRATDAGIVALSDLLAILLLPALFTDENLLGLLALTAVELSIHHGLTDGTASAAIMAAVVAGSRLGRYDEADAFGRLGRAIVEARGLGAYRAKVYLDFTLVNHWTHPLRSNAEILRQALEAARATGNFAVASYALNNQVTLSLALGTPLVEVQRQCEDALPFVRRAGYPMVESVLTSQLRLVMNLRGLTARFSTFDGDGFDERAFVETLETNPLANTVAICWHFIRRLQARFLSGDYEQAYTASTRARELLWTSRSFVETPECLFYTALTLAALHDRRPAADRPGLTAGLLEVLERFEAWAVTCPANFVHRRELVAAELCRVQGEGLRAMGHYERAIRAAHDAGFVQNEAIAYELASRYCRSAGFSAAAALYLTEARRCYQRWGADGKVEQLERLFRKLEEDRTPVVRPPAGPREELDLMAVAKASQAISMELSWERVARRLLEVALEQGGADRSWLLVKQERGLVVAGRASVDEGGVTTELVEPPRPPGGDVVPIAIAELVCRTRERVMLDNPATNGAFTGDAYIRRHKPRSLLCLPIVSRGDVIAVLYLENKLASGAFTPDHLAALEVIAAQAAIALANADLFAKLERENAERRRAEAFLEESRGRLQQIIDNNAAVIFVKDVEGRYLLANRAFEELFGLNSEEVRGKTDRYLPIPPGTADAFRANDLVALHEDRAIEFEESAGEAGGARTYLSIKFPLHDASGRAYAVGGIASDITGRKRFEDQLRASVSLLQATLESTGDAILVVGTDGRVVQYNRRFVDTWGAPTERADGPAGRPEAPFDLTRVRAPAALRVELARLAAQPEESSFDIVELQDGRIFEAYSQPQRMEDRVVGRVWSFRDVTGRVNAQRERDRLLVDERKARTAAEDAVRARDDFLSVASHELRTPLTSLQLAIQGLSRHLQTDIPAAVERNLALSRRQLRRLGGLVGLLLDVSRIQAGRLELDRHVIDLRAVVRESAAQLSEDLSRAGSTLTVRGDHPVIGLWDASRMEQLSINLLTNAIKFGSKRPIDVTIEEQDGRARLVVKDRGIGMPLEVQSRIFERYERGVSARHYAGLGLGLFIVRTIVEAHGGFVSVESAVGHGATFTVELPTWPTPPERTLEAAP
jgi:PAS domain S-box-containing protein